MTHSDGTQCHTRSEGDVPLVFEGNKGGTHGFFFGLHIAERHAGNTFTRHGLGARRRVCSFAAAKSYRGRRIARGTAGHSHRLFADGNKRYFRFADRCRAQRTYRHAVHYGDCRNDENRYGRSAGNRTRRFLGTGIFAFDARTKVSRRRQSGTR